MTAPLLEVRGLSVDTMEGRPLLRDLSLELGADRVALVGRNGVGKSTLLEILAGRIRPARGSVIARVEPVYVPQDPDPALARRAARALRHRAAAEPALGRALARDRAWLGLEPLEALAERDRLSRGEVRKLSLLAARLRRPQLLLLDEPTEDLDQAGLDWLVRWVSRWRGGLLVASHHRPLLRCFEHFFVVAESGCRYRPGPFADLERALEQEDRVQQRRYVEHLNTLAQREAHDERVSRRRQRKKNVGRLHELRRCTSRARLNEKRGHAQQSQARVARIQADRIESGRGWARATRRALAVNLPLELVVPRLPLPEGRELVILQGVGVRVEERWLFEGLDVRLGRERLAIVGPNGAGKTTLLEVIRGQRAPTAGTVRVREQRIGAIAQGGADWMRAESLLDHLRVVSPAESLEALAALLVAHRFPLALAQRPLQTLSPGERVRAALIGLYRREPAVELLVLDEPTYCLDFVGAAALRDALAAWPGGLCVASHDREFLESVGFDRTLVLDGRGGHRVQGVVGPHASALA